MSKDIIILTPNGRRQKISCSPDTCILQILEDVCQKHGLHSSNYNLKHHNRILDLTTTIRFSNIPNKATLEMVETEKKREESSVTIGLLLEDGVRKTGDFDPNTSLYDIVVSLAPSDLNSLNNPTILYMRQEVIGTTSLQQKTLRHLGLIGGKAILRLFNKAEEPKQANVSAVYRIPFSDSRKNEITDAVGISAKDNASIPGPSKVSNEDTAHTDSMESYHIDLSKENVIDQDESNKEILEKKIPEASVDLSRSNTTSNSSLMTQENLERRLKIEEQVTYIGSRKAIVFMPPDKLDDSIEDLPDDFYELTVEDVRKLYNDLKKQRSQMEDQPLMTSSIKEELEKQSCERTLKTYKNVVVRIQFPDSIILQGVFLPTNTLEDVVNFVKEHLHEPTKQFHIFTVPLKEKLDLKTSLLEAKYVPCVHMHFRWLENKNEPPYLKEELYSKKTCTEAAQILASKYRAPNRRKIEDQHEMHKTQPSTSTTKNSKVPKWFKK